METLIPEDLKTYSIAEYLAMEDSSVEKHEFYNGKIIKMPGAKPNHNIIAANIITALNNALEIKEKKYP